MKNANTFLKILTVSFLMINVISVSAQDATENQNKLETYLEMQRIGKDQMIGGALTMVVGTSCCIYSIAKYHDGTSTNFSGILAIVGPILNITGNLLLVSGFHKNRDGKRNAEEYQSKLDNLKVGSYYTPNHVGITLTYRF